MDRKLFLLDGMALVYRAHFALIARPIFTSKGVNTSALYGFTQTVLDILKNQQPTHIAVAFDTEAPTQRHADYPEYKATRQTMPEDLALALPAVRRLLEALRIPALSQDGFEADDIIGTLAMCAEKAGFTSYLVTPDKDFGQLVTDHILLYRPGRMGEPPEVLGVKEVCERWGIQHPRQVIDLQALMGDSVDNVPGIPGVGEKTAAKLLAQFGSLDALLARTHELKGKLRETVEKNQELARLSRKLVTLNTHVPCDTDLDSLRVQPADEPRLRELLVEFEFNSIGRRLFGEDFKAGRGFTTPEPAAASPERPAGPAERAEAASGNEPKPPPEPLPSPALKSLADAPHRYRVVDTPEHRARLLRQLRGLNTFGFSIAATSADTKAAWLQGLAFATEPGQAAFVPLPEDAAQRSVVLREFTPLFSSESLELTGHHLKHAVAVLGWEGVETRCRLFDIMVAHSLLEPDLRHSLQYLAEAFLGYTPLPETAESAPAQGTLLPLDEPPPQARVDRTCETADLALRLRQMLEPQLREKSQERVFFEIEAPLIPVLAAMEREGIQVDAAALSDFGRQLAGEIEAQEQAIYRLAGRAFNVNSPRQLGQLLFEELKIAGAPKKTRTGQYATDEQTLLALAPDHEIVRRLLDHRAASKLKSTYADALPASIWPRTGRVHTTYHQVMTATGRLNSQNPNLQNIPIRSERGQEIRKAFVPRSAEFLLASADYSQIELRIIAALSEEPGLLEAFRSGLDVHTATAARVFGVALHAVTPEMRRKAKMVNYGIAYGISAFGLAQRLQIPRKEAAEIIDNYFQQFAGIRRYMEQTIAFARDQGYVQTVTGRRRYIRDIRSANAAVRGAAERNAINAPIQGSAADMIKLAMIAVHRELTSRRLRTRLLLQVHDELVLELFRPEQDTVLPILEEKMRTAIPLAVPVVVEIGVGANWLEAH